MMKYCMWLIPSLNSLNILRTMHARIVIPIFFNHASVFGIFLKFYDTLNLYVAVRENYECKLLVFLYLYVGGSNELPPRGSFLQLPPRWILPADCRRPPLSLSWCGSPMGTAEWSEWTAWTYAVSLPLYMHIYAEKLWRYTKIYCNSVVFSSNYFALQKLKKEAAEDGAFLICWSAVNYDYLMLVVHKKNEVIL